MSRFRKRSLLAVSLVWVLLIASGALLAYPSVGPIAASIEPNPFWSVDATGSPSAPFRVGLKTVSWLVWTSAPLALLWALTFLSGRRPARHAG